MLGNILLRIFNIFWDFLIFGLGWEWRQIAVGKQQTLFLQNFSPKMFRQAQNNHTQFGHFTKEGKNKPFQMHIYFYANRRKLTKSEVLTK